LWLASITNAAVALLVVGFTLTAGRDMHMITEEVDQQTITMSDYTIRVKPKHDREWTAYKVTDQISKDEQRRRLQNELATELERLIRGSRIAQIDGKAAVNVAWNECELIRLWRQQLAELYELEAALKQYTRSGVAQPVEALLGKMESTSQQVSSLQDSKEWVPVAVFVTFESDDHYDEALAQQFITVGDIECAIKQAPEPETIKWDHLQYSSANRALRSAIIFVVTVVMLVCGVWAILESAVLKEAQSYTDACQFIVGRTAERGSQGVCPGSDGTNRPYYRAAYEVMSQMLPYRDFPRVRDHMDSLPYGSICPRSVNVAWVEIAGTQSLITNVSWPSWAPSADGRSANCHRVDSASAEASSVLYEDGDVDSMCYACICSVSDDAVTESDYCKLFREDRVSASNWGLLATLLVVAVNQGLKQLIVFSAPQLRSHTMEEELQSKTLRIYFCQLTNTAILVLLTKSDLGPFSNLPGEHYKTMNAKWYANIAAPMVLTMFVQFLTPLAFHFIFHFGVGNVLRCVSRRNASTQNQLNAVEAPKARDFAAGYGEILLAMSVTLIYGPGVPMLYFVAAFGFALRVVVEKWFDLRIYEKPHLYHLRHIIIMIRTLDRLRFTCF
jgi:hypothetical protein